MKPAAFEYRRAHTAEEAIEQLAQLGEDAKLLAGGQSLVPMMNFRLASPSALIDINGIFDLQYIEPDGEGLKIGALTPHRWVEVMEGPDLLENFSVLKRAARWVGHYPIRTRGTFGGSIAHADPSAEWCMLALLLDAEIVAAGPGGGERVIPASEFFHGFFMTALQPDEIIIEVRFPKPTPYVAIQELARRAGDFAIVSAAAALDLRDSVCDSARVVLGGVADVPLRVEQAEKVLKGAEIGQGAFQEAGQEAAKAVDPTSDVHGSAEYRRDLAGVLVERALREAVGNGK